MGEQLEPIGLEVATPGDDRTPETWSPNGAGLFVCSDGRTLTPDQFYVYLKESSHRDNIVMTGGVVSLRDNGGTLTEDL